MNIFSCMNQELDAHLERKWLVLKWVNYKIITETCKLVIDLWNTVHKRIWSSHFNDLFVEMRLSSQRSFLLFCNDLLIIGVYIIEKAEGLNYWHVNKLSWTLYIPHLQYSAKILQVKKHGVKVFLTRYFVMCIQYEICPLFGYILLSIDLNVKKRKRCRKPRTSG